MGSSEGGGHGSPPSPPACSCATPLTVHVMGELQVPLGSVRGSNQFLEPTGRAAGP